MVEILKPTEYKRIFEGIDSEWDEMDIMEHLENFADYYEKTTYHYHRTLTRKLEAVDPYDSEYEVSQFLEGHGSDIPTVATFKDAPNPELRFAKVYADFMLYASDIDDTVADEDVVRPTRKLTARLNESQLTKLHEHLVDIKYLEAGSLQDFLSIFKKSKNTEKQIVWKLKHNNSKLNHNMPLLTLLTYIQFDSKLGKLDKEDSTELVPTIVDTSKSFGVKKTIGKGTLRGSYIKWLPRIKKHFKLPVEEKNVPLLDIESKKLIKFIDSLT